MRRLIPIALLIVVGCARSHDECGAEAYRGLVGAPLAAVTLPAEIDDRVIRPGDVVTQDFVPTRLNIEVDRRGSITRLFCG